MDRGVQVFERTRVGSVWHDGRTWVQADGGAKTGSRFMSIAARSVTEISALGVELGAITLTQIEAVAGARDVIGVVEARRDAGDRYMGAHAQARVSLGHALETLRLAIACTRSWREQRGIRISDVAE